MEKRLHSKKYRGLGLKNLHLQNNCLFMKFAAKALASSSTSWMDWLDLQHTNALVSPPPQTSFLCRTIAQQIPTLQSITFVLTISGMHTYFWHDTWLTPTPLAHTYPYLFSHSTLQLIKVANVLRYVLEANLRNHLSLLAEQELVALLAVLQDFVPSAEEDQRFLIRGLAFSTKQAYDTLMARPDCDPLAPIIWHSKVPRKIKIFTWLLFKDRLNTRANLVHKHIISTDVCPRCAMLPEDSMHLFLTCPVANRVWQRLGILPQAEGIIDLWDAPIPHQLPHKAWPFILMSLLWKIWAARNDMLFRNIDQRSVITLRALISDLDLWSHRLMERCDKEDVSSWRSYLSARCIVPL
ncbi:hypothetical protein VPH35_025165 [Triticum aestivum]